MTIKNNIYQSSLSFALSIFFLMVSCQVAKAELDLSLPDYNLPDIGASSVGTLSYAKERQIGLKVLREIRSSAVVIEDPEISAWIRSLGNRLSARSPNSSNPFYFLVVKDKAVNAYATLGGVIVVNTGLILQTASESELAAVLSHEIAHVTQRHIARMMEKSRLNTLGAGVAVLAGILASSKSPDAGQAIITGAIAMQAHKALIFSRAAESEADRVGLRILAASGFNPMAMPKFLQKLESEFTGVEGNANEYLRSHPLSVNRVSGTRSSALKYGAYKGKSNSEAYLYMREKIRSLVRATGRQAIIPNNIPTKIRRYADSVAFLQRGNASLVLKTMGVRSSNKSDAALIAEALLIQRNYLGVVKLLTPLVRLYPGENALVLPLANAYLGLREAQKAWLLMKTVVLSEQSSLLFFEVKQNIARQLGLTGSAYHAVAERNMRLGNYKAALAQLRQAMKSGDISGAELRILQTLLDKVEMEKKQEGDDN
ncbi:MAG TPA: hypothetical protein EYG68_09000 [Leucothrix mucor]|nr:hypothetical protein [Leucothrix mucor]